MEAKNLRERVTIQSQGAVAADAFGSKDPWANPVNLDDVWARIEPLSGGEAIVAGGVQASIVYRVTIRYRADLTPAHRLKWGTAYLYPESLLPDEGHTTIVMLCGKR